MKNFLNMINDGKDRLVSVDTTLTEAGFIIHIDNVKFITSKPITDQVLSLGFEGLNQNDKVRLILGTAQALSH